MTIRTAAALAALITLSTTAHAAPAPRDMTGFGQPYPYHLNKIWNLEAKDIRSGAPGARLALRTTPLVVDLAKGTAPGACQTRDGAWTGQATYLNSDVGTIQYWGMGRGCHPTGIGTVQYADGSTYFGFVETYLYKDAGETADIPLQRDRVRVAVRDGYGQSTDARTGQVTVGWWSEDRLVKDLGTDARFIEQLRLALASIADRGAPQYTAAILDWSEFDPAPKPAAPAAPAADAHRQRAAANAAAAKDPTRIPQPLLDAHPALAALAPVLQRFGGAPMGRAPAIETKFLGGIKCRTPAGEDARWSDPTTGIEYLGEHQGCVPRGVGRFRIASGEEWIGEVMPFDKGLAPLPGGFGEIRKPDGTRDFVRYVHVPKPPQKGWLAVGDTSFTLYGRISPDGVIHIRKEIKEARAGYAYSEASEAAGPLRHIPMVAIGVDSNQGVFEVHALDGAIVTTYFKLYDLKFSASRTSYRIPELGLRVEGVNEGDGESRGSATWKGWIFVTLEQPLMGHPPGRYYHLFGHSSDDPRLRILGDRGATLDLFDGRLRPRDGATVNAMRDGSASCPLRFPAAELPAGWVVWWPSCDATKRRLSAYSPQARYALTLTLAADGRVVERELVRDYGMGGSNTSYRWIAERFELRPSGIVPVGTTKYLEHWGYTMPHDWGFPDSGMASTRNDKVAGWQSLEFQGPMDGLRPEGVGSCQRGKGREPCEFRGGRRVDAAQAQRQQRYDTQVAAQRQREAAAWEQEKKRRAAEEAEQARLEAEYAAAEAEKKRRREAEDAEVDAENEAMWARDRQNWAAKQQADAQRFAQQMDASTQQYNAAVAAAKAMQAQQAEQDRLNREEAARQERDRQAGERAYAESQARNAQAKAQAEAAYQQQRQIDQAKAQAAANDAARRAAGAYGSAPSSYSGSSSSAPSGGRAPVPGSCLQEQPRKFGGHCNNPRSVTVTVKNVCDSPIDIRTCIDTPAGTKCETNRADPGETVSQWQCELSGGVGVSGTAAN